MNDRVKALLERFTEFWSKYTSKQKTMIISVIAGVIFALGFLIFIFGQTKYEVLTTFESTKDASEATGYLTEAGIAYDLTTDALTVKVDKKKVAEARLVLGQNGLGSSSEDPYEGLFDVGFSTTDSQWRLKAKIAKQQEISDTIKAIDGVKSVAVTLDIPESTNSIYKTESKAYASIMLTTTTSFDEDSVEGIASYVANSIGSSNTENVRIMNQSGKLLFAGNSGVNSATNSSITLEKRVISDMEASIRRLLINSGVYNDAEVMADLDINLDETEILRTEYFSNDEDETGPLDSKYTYSALNSDGVGGAVGTDANGEEIVDYNIPDDGSGSSEVTVNRMEYSTSSEVTSTKKAIGTINRDESSVAIILSKYVYYDEAVMKKNGELDGTTFEKFQAENSDKVSIEVTDDMYTIVQMATGISKEKIQILAYEIPVFYPKDTTTVTNVVNMLPIVLAVLIVGLLAFVVLKGMKPLEVTELEPELSVEALLATTKENQTLDDIEFSDKSATREQIEKFVDENPGAVAQLLRNWLSDEWE